MRLLLLTPVDASLPGATELLVPAWGGDGGLNDRFAVAGPTAALAFGSRLGVLQDFVEAGQAVHAERFLHWAMRDAAVKLVPGPCGVRIRPDGWESAPTRRACDTRTRGYLLAGSRTSCA